MDDFGTGESSLNMLDDIPVDIIKLDKCFLDRSDTSLESRIILSKVVEMSHLLGKKVVCEGVENQSQVQFLKSIKCDMVQGYYYSRPLKPEDFQAFMFNNI
jgi:EAL domain-containing protein (putative c-di-GMP-specific phosphodiesterase class I)